MLAQDSGAAGEVARVIVGTIRRSSGFRLPPRELNCLPEEEFASRFNLRGRRADLVFYKEGSYALVVEAKLLAPTSKKQVADYLNAPLKGFGQLEVPADRFYVALVANRAVEPKLPKMAKRGRWLGAGTWPELFLGLESVTFASEERKLRWMALLSHYRTAWAVDEDSRRLYSTVCP